MGSSALAAALTKDGLSRLLSYMPDPGSREPGATIGCCACRKTYKTASGLVRHLCNFHGAHMDWLAGSELLRARAREFAHTKSKWKKAHQGGTSKPPGPRDGGSPQHHDALLAPAARRGRAAGRLKPGYDIKKHAVILQSTFVDQLYKVLLQVKAEGGLEREP